MLHSSPRLRVPARPPVPGRRPRPLHRSTAAALLGLALGAGCSAVTGEEAAGAPAVSAPVEPEAPPAARQEEHDAPAPAPVGDREKEVIALVREGRLKEARELLGSLLVEQELDAARAALDAGEPPDALTAIDKALAIAPDDDDARLLKARASFALGESSMRSGGSSALVQGSFVDALRYFEELGDEPRAQLGASRAALRLQRYDTALAHAQRAIALLDAKGIEPAVAGSPGAEGAALVVDEVPERVLAEAAYRSYVQAKQDGADATKTDALFSTAEDALARLLGRDQGPWVWRTLVDLYQWKGDLDTARRQAESGLDREPGDSELIDRLARVAHAQGGPGGMADAFAAFDSRHPGIARGLWYEAQGRFDEATDLVVGMFGKEEATTEANAGDAAKAGDAASADTARVPDLYREAEELYRRCAEGDATFADGCTGYEALCRDGLGWYYDASGRYEEALAAFRSMEDVAPGAMTYDLEGRLLSGVLGVHTVGTHYRDANQLEKAGEIYAYLHAYQPEDVNWANNQGFFLRDAAVEIEALGKRLCAAAGENRRDDDLLAALADRAGIDLRKADAPSDHALMARAANAAMDKARALMQQSWEGYQAAAALAPDDVRVVNDTALIQVYYLHTDLDRAEEMLQRCTKMGEEQLRSSDLDDQQRFELENAWGDAWQNLGVLYANQRNDPDRAVAAFQRAIEIGPEPRPLLTNFWIPMLKGELEADKLPDELRLKTWAEPCPE